MRYDKKSEKKINSYEQGQQKKVTTITEITSTKRKNTNDIA